MVEKRKQRMRTVPGELGRSTNANNSNYRFVGVRSEKNGTRRVGMEVRWKDRVL